jgi:hypothetical protein
LQGDGKTVNHNKAAHPGEDVNVLPGAYVVYHIRSNDEIEVVLFPVYFLERPDSVYGI